MSIQRGYKSVSFPRRLYKHSDVLYCGVNQDFRLVKTDTVGRGGGGGGEGEYKIVVMQRGSFGDGCKRKQVTHNSVARG